MGRIIGLTGGIGSGKSTVATMLAEKGATVIDADRVAHEVYEPGTKGYARVVERFGREIVGADDRIDRKRLGEVVFGDSRALRDLNAIVHPLVQEEVARRLSAALGRDPGATVVLEAALMTETGWSGGAAELWVVVADPEVAVSRLVRDRGMSEQDARARIKAQATNEERTRSATVVLENNGGLHELRRKVDAAWSAPGFAEKRD